MKIMQRCSLLLRKKKKPILIFHKFSNCCLTFIKKETQKISDLLIDTDNESSKFATRKWYVINDQNSVAYGKAEENDSGIKFEAKVIKPFLYDYSDEYILVTGDITATNGDANSKVTLKNFAPFRTCVTYK